VLFIGFGCYITYFIVLLTQYRLLTCTLCNGVDATGRFGISVMQKVLASIHILSYGLPADAVDEYVRIGGSAARQALDHFC
jgi:hypothetical protein